MSKISTYEVAPVPKLADKLIGTSVGGEIEDVTYNFTLQELLDVFLPVIPANNLQGVLDYGNTATQDINLFGTITTTNLDVTDTANFLDSYFVGETHIEGGLFDSTGSIGTAGQVLTSTGTSVDWVTLPPIFTPNLQQVLTVGNTSTIGIVLTAGLEATDVDTNTATINTNITIDGTITDEDASVGTSGSVLSSTVTGVKWVPLPVYSATSPLLFNSATGVFSIQQATNAQNGYLSAADWITFDGKQNAGNYITALTGQATASGPGSATVTLSNSAVIGKVLTGFNPIAGTINAADSILTAFGKTQSQINALLGGVQYQGTWNASANLPVLTSSVGVQGHYYVVNVAGNTNLNGITDWKIGDWAIFSESVWQKVDNTESVSSVNGFTGAVSLTTDDIPEGLTNLYFLNSRARAALSFLPGSGAYDNTSGAITIPTDNNQILNGAGYITYGSLSASSPLVYNNLTGAFSIPKATSLVDGYLSAADWSTFNGKQNYLGGTGLVKSTAGTISYITDNSSNWNTAYDRSIISAAVTGTTTKTLTLNEQDGGTITASWTDLDTGLTSVGVSMPGAFTVTNSPLTSNGTIAITGAGTTLQYIDGTGALRTFPTLTGYVPYTGATTNVDLGEFGISAGYFQADLTPTGALQVGRMQWNSTDGTMDLRLMGNNVTIQIGQENVTRVVNKTGIDLLEANYQVVRVRKVAEGGAQGQRLAVVLAQGNNENNSTEVIGLVTETINSNQEGFVTAFGEVKNINTTGSLQGETWVDGDILYLSDTVPGQLTKVRPIAPNHAVIVGYVTYAHVNNGKIYMAIDTGYELGELHNVYAPSPTANQSIYWNVANSRYQLNTIGGILGYTPADAATTLTINGTTYDLSANRTWSVGTVTSVAALTLGTTGTDLSSSVATGTTTPVITLNVPTASAANRGALSAADWSTFNTKVGSVTASSPLASSGGSTPNITIQQSSGSQDGYLSSTDWTTFNSKQAAGNYITSLTGEATATGPGAAAVTLNNASVTGKVLTGVNITGGTVQATDTMLTAFGKLQNQINGLIGSTIYQGTWNASTNTPALASGVGVRGYYYIVSVAGTTNLDGITDWFVGDWAIFDGTAWQQVDNTDAVVSVNGQTGAVSLTTDNIPEGATNQYYLDSRARAALSFTAGSGAYNSTTGVITIPTNTSQLTNGANFITLASLSGTAPIQYNNTTGAISITQSGTASNGFLSSTDWNTFNNKQATITLTTTGTTGAATLIGATLNIPNYSTDLSGYVPYTGATANVNLGTFDLTADVITGATGSFASSGGSNTFAINHSSGSGIALNITKGGNEEGLYINKTSGSGNAATIIGILNATTLVKSGGTSSQFLMADGSVNTSVLPSGAYLPLTGGTLTGALNGTSANFSNDVQSSSFFRSNTPATNSITIGVSANTNYSYIGYSNNWGIRTGTLGDFNIDVNNSASPINAFKILQNGAATFSGNIGVGVTISAWLSAVNVIQLGAAHLFGQTVGTGTVSLGNNVYLNSTPAYIYQYNGKATRYSQYDGQHEFYTAALGTAGNNVTFTQAMTLFSTGNLGVGVGNIDAGYKLDINGSARFTSNFYVSGGTNTNVGNGIHAYYDAGYAQLQLNGVTGSVIDFSTSATDYKGRIIYDNTANSLNFHTNSEGTPKLTLASNGAATFLTSITGTNAIFANSSVLSTVMASPQLLLINNAAATINQRVDLGLRWEDGTYNGIGGISMVRESATARSGRLVLSGINSSGNPNEALNITSGGNVLINTTSNSTGLPTFHIQNKSGLVSNIAGFNFCSTSTAENANNNLIISGGYYNGSAVVATQSSAAIYQQASGVHNFYSNEGLTAGNTYSVSNRMAINSNGSIYMGTTSGVSGGGLLQVNGNVNINGVFQINGVTIGGGGGSGITGSGTTNYIPKYTSSTSIGNSVIFDNGTNVGVNTNSPNTYIDGESGMAILQATNGRAVLTLAGTRVDADEALGRLSFTNSNATTAGSKRLAHISGYRGTTNNSAYLEFATANDAIGVRRMLITQTGNVLINTSTDAGYKFDVNGGTRIQGNLRLDGSSVDSPILTIVGVTNTLITMGDSTSATTDIGIIQIRNGGTPVIQLDAGSGTNSYFNTGGGLLVNTIVDAGAGYKLQVNGSMLMTYTNFFNFRGSSGAGDVLVDNSGSTLRITGNVTVAGSVTATGGFFDTSDSRLKIVIKDYNQAKGIEKVAAKFYVKNGRKELGYFAQDLQEILPSAVAEGADGFLTLSYSQVHTAKIAVIEDEVTILKNRVSDLESKLLKYEA